MNEGKEQEARIALLEHYTSQMQGYKLYILTLALGSVGFSEVWSRFVDGQRPSFLAQAILLPFVIGLFCAALFYCLARAAWYGALASNCLLPLPYTVMEAPARPLLARLSQKICDRVRDNPLEATPEFTPRGMWGSVQSSGDASACQVAGDGFRIQFSVGRK